MPPRQSAKLDQHLVLQTYLLRCLEVDDFDGLRELLSPRDLEGLTADGSTKFLETLLLRVPALAAQSARFRLYDENIVHHTAALNQARIPKITWKYFQWVALLFTEIYLDEYLSDASGLCARLNRAATLLGAETGADVEPYSEAQLRKLAFWLATGSGKTLIMHVNILQYQHYLQLHRGAEPDRVLVLTPNEGLSEQHARELKASSFAARLFDRESPDLFTGKDYVDVIDIHKLRDEPGEKTVAVESFSGHNLVLVDEGHRGASGTEWRDRRDQLTDAGFAFEYSATFGQVVGSDAAAPLFNEYAKAIALDYSYRLFYTDGFGKDFRILNLAGSDTAETVRYLYLTGCLLTFLQQLLRFEQSPADAQRFQIEKPLWVFVGGSVTQSTRERTDVIEILHFVNWFLTSGITAVTYIERLMRGTAELTTTAGENVFRHAFAYLEGRGATPAQVYDLALRHIFNSRTASALQLAVLARAPGEIAMSVGSNEPFGVINVGDAPGLIKAVAADGVIEVQEQHFGGSMFDRIDDAASQVQMLVGARKFIEGWNSWRVANLGLMNVGRNEGPQVIQLFGRGVRLKGEGLSLMRSRALGTTPRPEFLDLVETLFVFGIRADYVRQFRDYMAVEGLAPDPPVVVRLPTKKRRPFPRALLQPRIADDLTFVSHGPAVSLAKLPIDHAFVEVDWYPRVAAIDSAAPTTARADKNTLKLPRRVVGVVDREALLGELVAHKRARGFANLIIARNAIDELLDSDDWYELTAPAPMFDGGLAHRRLWQELATSLLRRYVDAFYKYHRDAWEMTRLTLEALTPTSANMIDGWRLTIDSTEADYIARLNRYLTQGTNFDLDGAAILNIGEHLYEPVVYASRATIKATPVALNRGEHRFLVDLAAFCHGNPGWLKDKRLFVLRNMSRGRGIGFFEANNFYPDFMLWVLQGQVQHLTFVDPKGLMHLGKDDPKIRFHKVIRNIEKRLANRDVILNSFILSSTPFHGINWREEGWTPATFADDHHVLFQDDADYVADMLNRVVATTSAVPAPNQRGSEPKPD